MLVDRRSRAAAILCLVALGGCGGRAESPGQTSRPAPETPKPAPRNPFGFPDIEDCCGADVQEFVALAPQFGARDDPNAEAWAAGNPAEERQPDSIDGSWQCRWTLGDSGFVPGSATIRSTGSRVYIHYRDEGDYFIEAERDGDRLAGRYVNLSDPRDTTPWVAKIVGLERIDGAWTGGRWDCRRRVAAPGP